MCGLHVSVTGLLGLSHRFRLVKSCESMRTQDTQGCIRILDSKKRLFQRPYVREKKATHTRYTKRKPLDRSNSCCAFAHAATMTLVERIYFS